MRDLNEFDLNLLRVFDALMYERSVTLASARLNLTQPAVSNALARLRSVFGDPLFVRSRNGMEPTALATAISNPIHEGLAAIRAGVSQEASFDPATSRRFFTVLATDVGELAYVVPLLKELEREAPNIDVKILEAGVEEYGRLLEFGDADFALGRFNVSGMFRYEFVGTAQYVAVMCAAHARKIGVANGGEVPYRIYLEAAHVHVVPRGATENPIEPALGDDAKKRRVALELPHTSVLSAIIPGTALVATVPQPVVSSLCRGGELIWGRLPFSADLSRVYIGWHKRNDYDKGHIWMREKLYAMAARALAPSTEEAGPPPGPQASAGPRQ